MRAGDTLTVRVPPTRSDVLHACDVAEDVAVAHGFNNVAETLPKSATIGRELPLNQLTELLRSDIAAAGFTEVLTWALCSRAENFGHLRRQEDGAVEIGNPATQEFQVRLCAFAASCVPQADAVSRYQLQSPAGSQRCDEVVSS